MRPPQYYQHSCTMNSRLPILPIVPFAALTAFFLVFIFLDTPVLSPPTLAKTGGIDPVAAILPPSAPDRMASAMGMVYLRRELRSFFIARGYEMAMDDEIDAAWASVMGIDPPRGNDASGDSGSVGKSAWDGKSWLWIDSRVKSGSWPDPMEPPPSAFLEKASSILGARVVVWSRLKDYRAVRDRGNPYSATPLIEEDLDWTRFFNDPTRTGGTIHCFLGGRVVVWHAPDKGIIHDRVSVLTHDMEFFGSIRSRLEALRGGIRKMVALLLDGLYER